MTILLRSTRFLGTKTRQKMKTMLRILKEILKLTLQKSCAVVTNPRWRWATVCAKSLHFSPSQTNQCSSLRKIPFLSLTTRKSSLEISNKDKATLMSLLGKSMSLALWKSRFWRTDQPRRLIWRNPPMCNDSTLSIEKCTILWSNKRRADSFSTNLQTELNNLNGNKSRNWKRVGRSLAMWAWLQINRILGTQTIEAQFLINSNFRI